MDTNNSDEIKLKLSATNQSGVIAALHLIANKFNVKVKDSLVSRVSRERSRVVVIFAGTLNASQAEFTTAIESHSRIYSIDAIEINANLNLYSDDEIASDDNIYEEDAEKDIDYNSVVNEFEEVDLESDSTSNIYHNNAFGYGLKLETYAGNELKSLSDENNSPDIAAESASMAKMDLHYNEKSPLKASKRISYKFNANDSVTDESLETTEQILIDLLGPIASLFVSSAVIEADTMGELFVLLSEELDGEVKSNFLRLIKGLDKSHYEIS